MTHRTPTLGVDAAIDIDRLLVSRLLVQANSGGGKSYALRRLLEQTFGLCQHIVIDPEGEFHTLREKYDYILAGKGGEAAATVETAPLLARRLLELGVSAIIDISELGVDRPAFVTRFIEALMAAPRELWRPLLIVVDEAHRYCPQGVVPRQPSQRDDDDPLTPADSAAAVISLMDAGRKRGFCGVLATQRISKLSKDATAECNNKMIGRCVEIDAKRAGDELGLSGKEAIQQLRKFKAGQFFIFGPALSDEVRVIHVGAVETTHPEAGKAAPPPTPPRDKVRQVLGKLKDLPAEAAESTRTVERLRARIAELEAARPATSVPIVKERVVEVPMLKESDIKRLQATIEKFEAIAGTFFDELENVGQVVSDLDGALKLAQQLPPSSETRTTKAPEPKKPARKVTVIAGKHQLSVPADSKAAATLPRASLDSGDVLDAIALIESLGIAITFKLLAAWLGVHPNSKGFLGKLGKLREDGLLDGLQLTAEGRAVARAPVPKTDKERRELLRSNRSEQELRVLDTIAALGGDTTHKKLAAWMGMHPNSKSLLDAIGRLRGVGMLNGHRLTNVGQLMATARPMTTDDVLGRLDDLQRRIVTTVIDRGEITTHKDLAATLGMHPNTRSLLEGLGSLRTRGLLTNGWPVKPTEVFTGAA